MGSRKMQRATSVTREAHQALLDLKNLVDTATQKTQAAELGTVGQAVSSLQNEDALRLELTLSDVIIEHKNPGRDVANFWKDVAESYSDGDVHTLPVSQPALDEHFVAQRARSWAFGSAVARRETYGNNLGTQKVSDQGCWRDAWRRQRRDDVGCIRSRSAGRFWGTSRGDSREVVARCFPKRRESSWRLAIWLYRKGLVSREGIEPSTYGLRVHCSAS